MRHSRDVPLSHLTSRNISSIGRLFHHPRAPRLARGLPASRDSKAALTLDPVGSEAGADFCLLGTKGGAGHGIAFSGDSLRPGAVANSQWLASFLKRTVVRGVERCSSQVWEETTASQLIGERCQLTAIITFSLRLQRRNHAGKTVRERKQGAGGIPWGTLAFVLWGETGLGSVS